MLTGLLPRDHGRYSCLPILGPHLDGFLVWLREKGYPPLPMRRRIRRAPQLEALIRRRRIRDLRKLSARDLLELIPSGGRPNIEWAAAIRSFVGYFGECGMLAVPPLTPPQRLIEAYRTHLQQTRGLAPSTVYHHTSTATEFLRFIRHERRLNPLRKLAAAALEGFLQHRAMRNNRASLQHVAAHLRSFLRFLASRGQVPCVLAGQVDTPRVYRGERLPRSLPWETVQAFLKAIDRTTAMGRRDYAMFLLMATYGLRASEIVALSLEDLRWRERKIRVPRPKVGRPLELPMTEEVGAAIVDYLQHGRPDLPNREVFLRARPPEGLLKPTAVTEAFQGWTRRGKLPISFQGPHCLRHALAMHLLRQGTALKIIGDLLGHRSAESTCVYLRLHVDDLRGVALDLPRATRKGGRR
jgi:integrase/recombinase XerD